MKSGSMHERATGLSRELCDGIYECGKSAISQCARNEAKGVCSIGSSPKFAFVYHSKNAIKVYLKCDEEDRTLLQALVASETLEIQRRKTIKAESWEQTFPYFMVLRDQHDLEAAYPVISHLAQETTVARNQKFQKSQKNELHLLVQIHEEEQLDQFDPGSEDLRERIAATIVRRRGQPAFRKKLIEAYGGICAFTGCDAVDALEAAHIQGYLGEHSHHVTNGLLLRADCHVLFDLGLIGVDKTSQIIVAPNLLSTTYRDLQGLTVRFPANKAHWPDANALEFHRRASKYFSTQ